MTHIEERPTLRCRISEPTLPFCRAVGRVIAKDVELSCHLCQVQANPCALLAKVNQLHRPGLKFSKGKELAEISLHRDSMSSVD